MPSCDGGEKNIVWQREVLVLRRMLLYYSCRLVPNDHNNIYFILSYRLQGSPQETLRGVVWVEFVIISKKFYCEVMGDTMEFKHSIYIP